MNNKIIRKCLQIGNSEIIFIPKNKNLKLKIKFNVLMYDRGKIKTLV